jgi:HlyD family secretion protein
MAEARTQTRRWLLWAALAAVLMVVFLAARSLLRERLPVRLAQVTHETLLYTTPTNGKVEPVANYQYYSPIATTVKAVYAKEGDKVRAGKLLIALDDLQARAQVAAAESGVKTAQATVYAATHNGTQAEQQASAAEVAQDKLALDQAQQNLDALTKLAAAGAAAQGEVTAAHDRLQTAEASLTGAQMSQQSRYAPVDVARAQAALADAEASLEAAKHVEEQTSFYAPIAGTVYTLDAAPTEYSEQGKLLVEVADLHSERVRAYFDEPDVGRLAVGQKVTIRWDAQPGREWYGHVAQLPATIVEYTTRFVGQVLIDFDGPDDGLMPHTDVTVTVTVSSAANALSMPREALHEQNGKYYVFKAVNGELKRTAVTIGAPTLTQVPILSGLGDGDTVATGTTNGEPLQQGIPIKEEK